MFYPEIVFLIVLHDLIRGGLGHAGSRVLIW